MNSDQTNVSDPTGLYLVDIKCQRCKVKLTDDEIVRIGRDKTLKLCEKCLSDIINLQNKWAPKFLKMKLL